MIDKRYFAYSLCYKHLPTDLDMGSNLGVPNKDLLYQEFGIALSNERRRKRISQAQFAAKVGLSRTSITNIECGRQPVQLHQLYLFASILQVDIVKLLPREAAPAELGTVHMTSEKKDHYIAQVVKAVTQGKP